jgi:hypothetical protein
MTANAAANNVLVEDLIVQRSSKGTALTFDEMDFNVRTIARYLDLVSGATIGNLQILLDDLVADVELSSNNFAEFTDAVAAQQAAVNTQIQAVNVLIANTIAELQATEASILAQVNTEVV